MNRPMVLGVGAAALVAAVVMVWVDVRQEREFRRLIAVGEMALAGEQTFVAIEAFSGALVLRRDSMLAHLKRGDTYRKRGEFSAALRDLREAASLDPTAPQPIELLGDVNAAMGRHERATEHYRAYLALDDRAPRVLYKLAAEQFRNGQPSKAVEPLRKAIALDDRFADAHYLLGMSLRTQNRSAEALRALKRAVALNATFAAAREELTDLLFALGQRREGIEQLEALAALDPRPERLVSVGLTYARFGRPDAAILMLGRAADRYPESPIVNTALGRVWLDTAVAREDRVALSKAAEALQPVTARADATSEALALYGRVLILSGDMAGAERVLQQAATRSPVEPLAFRFLADVAGRLGHIALAREAAARFATLSPAM